MAATITEVTRNTAKHLLHLISQTGGNLQMMEVTDHFDLIRELGKGSYGKVFLAKHRHSGQTVAIKMLRKEKTSLDSFLVEYSTSLSLSCHPHIIMTHEITFHTSSDFVFVQEMAPAGTLQSIIKPKVGLQEEMVKCCVVQIASALDFMHSRGMVHRDIKLDNILLMDTECHVIKLSDFGLARLQCTYTSSISWFIPYTAPELCSLRHGEQLLLHPSLDVWAFGVLVYTALTGLFPWQGAVATDQMYRDFAWWQVKKDDSQAPKKWKKFSIEARQMFSELLALNASERCSAMDIMKYIHFIWKTSIPPGDIRKKTDTTGDRRECCSHMRVTHLDIKEDQVAKWHPTFSMLHLLRQGMSCHQRQPAKVNHVTRDNPTPELLNHTGEHSLFVNSSFYLGTLSGHWSSRL
ncbi:serine/threonine-protein kinase SBK1-like [Pseudophryne corroboree]|uniref:serine/threonine-protein kinase SBK1-like n=1 Tax=Pseudophryne corroboree TaxID=495146 RepID=UPI0030814411